MEFVCEFVGGERNGMVVPLKAAEAMTDRRSEDLTAIRERGGLVHRAELDNKPVFDGYVGPMWDGTRPGDIAVLRYESPQVYAMLSV